MQQKELISFPVPLFPKINTTFKGQSVVDFGTNDGIDINFSSSSGIQSTSRKTPDFKHGRYITYQPCFPLTPPNESEISQIIEDVRDVWSCPHDTCAEKIAKELQTTSLGHLNTMLRDYPELLIDTILDELKDFDTEILYRQFHPLKYAYDAAIVLGQRQVPPENFREYFRLNSKRIFRTVNRFTRNDTHALECRSFIKTLDETLETIFEIPRSLLLDLIDEELINRYDLITENDHLGNCLSNCQDLLIYPKGAMNTLCISPVSCADNNGEVFPECNATEMQHIVLDEAVQEIDSKSYSDGNAIIGVRSDYCCSFLTKIHQGPTDYEEHRHFELAQTLREKSRILSMAVNPHFTNDAVICLENGEIRCWRDGVVKLFSDHQVHRHSNCDDIRWVNCIYGTSPTSILIIHPQDLHMYDTRAGPKSSQRILQLPNTGLNQMDKLRRPASLHPVDPHQILLTSELGFIVVDERFTNTPLITVNHYMRSSPQFLRVFDYNNDSRFHTLALLGGYRYRDTRLIELTQEVQPASRFLQDLASSAYRTQPPSCLGSPRKLSPPEAWLQMIKNDCRVVSPAVLKRMTQPLIGVGILPVEASRSNDLLAIQLTKPGDLFYQVLRNEAKVSESEADRKSLLNEECPFIDKALRTGFVVDQLEKRCREWTDKACELYNEAKLYNEEANLSTTTVPTNEGVIVDVHNNQMKARARFAKERSAEEVTVKSGDYGDACKPNKVSCDLSETNAEGEMAGSIGPRHGNVDGTSEDVPWRSRDEFSVEQSDDCIGESADKFCPICKATLDRQASECSGCNLDVAISARLKDAFENRLALTNATLGLPGTLPDFHKFVRKVEKSKDPVSVVLFTNWNNDEFYTPIDLTLDVEKGEESDVVEESEIRRTPRKKPKEDQDDDGDNWYLNASGRLVYKEEEKEDEKRTTMFGANRESSKSMQGNGDEFGDDVTVKMPESFTLNTVMSKEDVKLKGESSLISKDSFSSQISRVNSPIKTANPNKMSLSLAKKAMRILPKSEFNELEFDKNPKYDHEITNHAHHNNHNNNAHQTVGVTAEVSNSNTRKRRYSDAIEGFDAGMFNLAELNMTADYAALNFSPERKNHSPAKARTTPRKKKATREMGF